eukprot:CAMPEP_0114421074 /NCGR_PEP_ID=MMETSP0103-20121206/4888_1 /TAXON_ID=37642 ORGANISM="Paraphysomonas imperforata, Strain PA2" /NCGR_SAMPLE_ID=MMETSP0103 /ASSEMBLY_ACC=CAM_ASM_000201 /LENGTH=263 /DNA_ID=CAMNT_0001589579 /DNA_START=108 /DNA_END=899 /DNA_ORIENTATION=-
MYWYPRRCEVEGCQETEGLLRCTGCKMVHYCSKEHQKEDWSTHKMDCKVFKRNGLQGCFYTDDEILARYPLKEPSTTKEVDGDKDKCRDENEDDSEEEYSDEEEETLPQSIIDILESGNASCPICCCEPGSKPLTITRCCRQVICDTQENYQMFSYSREFCERSHERYTLCGHHGVETYCDPNVDWRVCAGCNPMRDGADWLPDKLWRGLNPYNVCPLLASRVPRHSLCETCSQCRGKFMSGLEGCQFGMNGITCLRCAASRH